LSVEAITWAFAQKVGNASAKSVLVAMANCADPDLICWPSMAYLEAVTEQDRKTVLRNVAKLKAGEYIAPTGYRTGRTNQIIVYQLNPPKSGTVEESQNRNSTENGTVPFFRGKGPVFPAKQAQKRDTEPKGTVRNKKSRATPLATVPVDVLVTDGLGPELASEFLAHRGALKKPLTARAWSDLKSEASKANWPLAAAVEKVLARGWISFQASYVQNESPRQAKGESLAWEGAR